MPVGFVRLSSSFLGKSVVELHGSNHLMRIIGENTMNRRYSKSQNERFSSRRILRYTRSDSDRFPSGGQNDKFPSGGQTNNQVRTRRSPVTTFDCPKCYISNYSDPTNFLHPNDNNAYKECSL